MTFQQQDVSYVSPGWCLKCIFITNDTIDILKLRITLLVGLMMITIYNIQSQADEKLIEHTCWNV